MVERDVRIESEEVRRKRRRIGIPASSQHGPDNRWNVDRVIEGLAHEFVLWRAGLTRVERDEEDADAARALEPRLASGRELQLILCRDVGDEIGFPGANRGDARRRFGDGFEDDV